MLFIFYFPSPGQWKTLYGKVIRDRQILLDYKVFQTVFLPLNIPLNPPFPLKEPLIQKSYDCVPGYYENKSSRTIFERTMTDQKYPRESIPTTIALMIVCVGGFAVLGAVRALTHLLPPNETPYPMLKT